MGYSHENLLTTIEEEFPDKVSEAEQFMNIEPPVTEERLYELCGDDEGLRELLEEMIEYFYRYTRDVCAQESLKQEGIEENLEEIRSRDEARTALHNSMIDSVRILARNMREKGKDATWLDPIDKKGRAGYATLALLTTFRDILKHHTS